MPPERDDYWRDIPNAIAEQDTRQQQADQWGAQARADLASQWADSARAELTQAHPDLSQQVNAPAAPPDLTAPASSVAVSSGPSSTAGDGQNSPSPAAPRAPLNDISQFGDKTLSYDEAMAACGPAAAVRLASLFGNAIPLRVALDAAKQVGWTAAGGMNGVGNEKRLLDQLGIPATLDTNPDIGKLISDAQSGNPVTLSTPNHYWTLSGYDPASGKFDVGQSGLVFRGGSQWMTLDQIKRLGGGINGALFVDSPVSKNPGTAAFDTGQVQRYVTPPAQDASAATLTAGNPSDFSPSAPPVAAPTGFDQGQTQDQVVQPPMQDGTSPIPWLQPQSPPFDPGQAVRTGFNNAVDTVGRALPSFDQTLDPASPIAQQAAGNRPSPFAVKDQATSGLADAIVPPNTPVASGAARALLDPTNLAFGAGGIPMALGSAAGGEVARTAAASLGGDETAQTLAGLGGSLVGGVGAGALAGGASAAARNPAVRDAASQFAQDESGAFRLPFGGGSSGAFTEDAAAAARGVPANARTVAMSDAPLPKASEDGLATRFIRSFTNRNVSADRFQESALKGAGLSTTNPPEALDLSSRIRLLETDGAVKVAEDTVLKPAVQAVGGGEQGRKLLSDVLMHQNNQDVAAALGAPYRTFPGGVTLGESQAALAQIEKNAGPAAWAVLQTSANQVYGLVKDLRQTMLDSGLIDKQTFSMWNGQMPRWVPTRILDYLDEAGGPKVGSKLSLSDNGVRHYTMQGTDKFREDPLGSVLGLVKQVNATARKNEAVNAALELDKLGGKPLLVPTDAPATAGSPIVQYIRDGTVERYVAPPQLASVLNGPQIAQMPGFIRNWTNFQRAVTTVVSPVFALVRNPSLDIPEYLLREQSRAGVGGGLALPRIMAELGKGYADAFQGLLQGEFRGSGAQQYMRSGGSGSTLANTLEGRQGMVEQLSRATPFEIKSVGDIQRILKDIVQLKPVAALAERTEMGPRIASMRLAEQRGMTPMRSTMAGRTVTMDFAEGGTLAKTINQVIPFFNAGIQGSAIPIRMFRDNPAGAIAATTLQVGLPVVAAEAWNRSDAQRSQDYNDVPQYLKQGGMVIMKPGDAPVDAQGNRKPEFWWVNMRGLAPFASIAREAAARALQAGGNQNATPEAWQQLAWDLTAGASPIRANQVSDVPGALTPNIGGVSTGTQLVANHDIFRNRDIATKRNDESASETGKAIAGLLTSMVRTINPKWDVHPAQVDFAVKDLLGGVGATALGTGDLGKGPRDQTPQNLPVAGGVLRAMGIRNDTGETFRAARDQGLDANATRWLQSQGVNYQPGAVGSDVNNIPLKQAEETRYQQLFNQYASEAIRAQQQNTADWAQLNPTGRDSRVKQLVDNARGRAGLEVLRSIPADERQRRLRTKSTAP